MYCQVDQLFLIPMTMMILSLTYLDIHVVNSWLFFLWSFLEIWAPMFTQSMKCKLLHALWQGYVVSLPDAWPTFASYRLMTQCNPMTYLTIGQETTLACRNKAARYHILLMRFTIDGQRYSCNVLCLRSTSSSVILSIVAADMCCSLVDNNGQRKATKWRVP